MIYIPIVTINFLSCIIAIEFVKNLEAVAFGVNLKSDKYHIIPYTKKKSLYGNNKLAHNAHLP